jgi:hypothetical protein
MSAGLIREYRGGKLTMLNFILAEVVADCPIDYWLRHESVKVDTLSRGHAGLSNVGWRAARAA